MPLKENVNLSNAKKITDFEKADVSRIRCTEIDSDGNIWIGFDQGLYSIRNNKLIKCEIRSQKEITLRPVQIVKDKYGYYWVGDFSFGLYRLKRDNTSGDKIVFDKVNEYKSLKTDSAFVTAWVQDMMIDHNGDLWMSSLYTGVYKLSINKSGVTKAHLYSSQNGLSSNSITQLVEDKKHNMWFAGPNGAVRMIRANDKKETFTYYNSRNGLGRVVYDILPGDDVACLGFAEGFYVVDINRKDVVNTPPKVTLSNIAVLGKTDSLAMRSTGICKLRHNQNFIAFDFASISFARENAILYQYRLLGLDDKWSNYSDRKFVTYNSLKPGRYAFQVRSRAVDGNQASEITEFAFRIRPPFYQTWWFVGLSTLLVITIVYLLYQYRIKQLLKLERLRSRIASDLHDDIGSTLSSISILSELLQTQLDANPRSSEMIRKIGSNARNMLESMDDIIWAVNPSNDKFRNLELRIREYAIPLLESKDINFTFSTPAQLNSLPIPMHVRRNVYLIAKEAINNLIKYSNCTEARIEFKENHTMLTMNISDNGKGFDTNVPTDRNGVKNMKQRAEQINAGITIHSAMQQGTQIELSIKII
ncbi:MAG TPA: triple tyrosine motif-containing protein [Bacteroidales bacterium]|nr:triple tyrosine motif-containing protein [Bacteroidales bacterium]